LINEILVEAAGVELFWVVLGVDNTQLIDSRNHHNG